MVAYARRLRPDGLVVATSGNLSRRVGDLVAITPSGLDYEELRPELVALVGLDGRLVEAPLAPSSELPMHLAAYHLSDCGAVVHTHSDYATVLSTLVDELPPIHYLLAELGGPVRTAPYATYGTEELAAGMAAALEGRHAALLQNHGAITIGPTLARAYARSLYLEWLCRVYHQARVLGEPRLLPLDEIERVAERLKGYGRPRPSPAARPSSRRPGR